MYKVDIEESINRILKTPLGARVKRPEYGSLLYTLRDRAFDEEYKRLAEKYTYEAITKRYKVFENGKPKIIRIEPRAKVENVDLKIKPVSGVAILVITLANGEVIEVKND
jgi:phage baseplate assembly protein W